MDRRQFLCTSGAAALSAPFLSSKAFAAPAASGDANLDAVFERIFQEQVRTFPGFATSLGLDKGKLAPLRAKLDVRPVQRARAEEIARTNKFIGWLEAVPEAGLSESAKLNREVVIWDLKTGNVGPERFDISNPQSPYVISQQDGAYFSRPDFLHSTHPIDTKSDAEAYLSRLAQFATELDNETAEQKRQAARGYLAPGWSLDLALKQMRELRAPAADQSTMAESVASRAAAKKIPGEWRERAAKIVADQVYPALDRQIAAIAALRPTTPAGDGVWRVPNGDAVYAAALAEATTTNYSADEIHQIGLQQVAEISAELDKILRSAGLTSGTVGERLTAFNQMPEQLYPNTDTGRAQLIDDLNAGVNAMYAKLPQAFATLPKQPLEIRRVPPEIQDGASNGYYRQATLDGSRPAIYFINLKSTADWPKYTLPSLTYHEGVPGHHLQLSIAQLSKDLPMLRRIAFYSAYGEGWALYAEQLADELGGYKGNERAGYLQSFLFRAERLIVDTGMNHKKWTREQAIEHMIATTGFARGRAQREIERYCASPGQACSYKIGHLAWLRAREEAKRTLGSKFDIRQFHEILREGAMPLSILERRIRERTAAQMAG
ncbi:DUF885 domain-containing protein [Sphingomonas hankyongi]|uniref:DUF885 family protein n=1 Tax=Sphingomonas hankyongi TaxID=2908209 RepID=A0ABT0S291_9SPHN|nr:DUF885 family protein [Sphingomonas hankyongi]MCL6729680.1 DUF885 family protein [Sphingomonas hankyongi]